jgi:molybdenum cofactor biosynthesis enzyme MoaA
MLITQEHFQKIYETNKVTCTCVVLILNNECNANCKVCLGKQVFKSALCKQVCECYTSSCLRCCDHIASDEEYYAHLNTILQSINSHFVNIIISGGEPTISERLIPVLEIIDKYNYFHKTIDMETNGANLLDAEIAQALIKRNVHIHLSRYCVDDEANGEEFNFSSYKTDNTHIKKYARIYGSLLCLSTVLLKKFIPNADALMEFVEYYRGCGIKQFSFIELMVDTGLQSANKEIVEYYSEQLITMDELSKQLAEKGYKENSSGGDEAFKFINYPYKDGFIGFTMSNLALQHNQPTNNNFSRFLIMPSGEIGVNGIEIR